MKYWRIGLQGKANASAVYKLNNQKAQSSAGKEVR